MRKFIIFALILVLLCNTALAALPDKYTVPSWVDSQTLCIPDCITTIEAEAYYGNTSITEVYIPASVKYIGRNAFANCPNLKRVVVMSRDTQFGQYALGTPDEPKEIWAPAQSYAKYYVTTQTYTVGNSSGDTDQAAGTYTYEDAGYSYVRITVDVTDLLTYALSLTGTTYGHYTIKTDSDGNIIRDSYGYPKYKYLDCVFFVYVCYRNVFGITLCQTCPAEAALSSQSTFKKQGLTATKITDISELMPGDIICWKSDGTDKTCTHVGLYIGNTTVNGTRYKSGDFIDASHSGSSVGVRNFGTASSSYTSWYIRNFLWAWRIL